MRNVNAPEDAHRARRQQALTFAAWAIEEILSEQHAGALAELLYSQRAGKELSHHAAKLAAIEDLRSSFNANLIKEHAAHAE